MMDRPTNEQAATQLIDSDKLQRNDLVIQASSNDNFSIYTPREKWFIVALTSFGGLFSPLTANIYLPAIPQLVSAFNTTTELINVTLTAYMVFQGLSPMVFGTLSDYVGRRPIFVICLLILGVSCIGLALTPTSAYWLLVLLRCVQAAGSASTIALGAGVIGDISTPAERGGFYGMFNLGPNLGPALGPVIGGLLSQHLGWRALFWFLCIASLLCSMIMILFMPETLRSLVGNGSSIPSRIYRPIVPLVGRTVMKNSARLPRPPFRNPLLLLLEWDVLLLLLIVGLLNVAYYSVISSTATLFTEFYSLSESAVGLCYLAIAGGMILGTTSIGKFLDIDYAKTSQAVALSRGQPTETFRPKTDFGIAEDFPIEKSRLRALPYLVIVLAACLAGYGWCIESRVSLAAPLVLQAAVGFVTLGCMSTAQTLIVDWFPGQSSSVTACNNLVRCSIASIFVALMDIILRSLGPGWTYVLMAGISLLILPLVILVVKIGPVRRKRRDIRALTDEATLT